MKKYKFRPLVFGRRHTLEIVAASRKEAILRRNAEVKELRRAKED